MKYLVLLLATFFLVSCKSGSENNAANDTGSDPTGSDLVDPDRKVGSADIIIETSMGPIKVKLHHDIAPVTVENFLSYVDKQHYDDTIFHRVISNFMIQGGGFQMNNGVAKEKLTGKGIKNESPQTQSNLRGTLSMARTGDPDSATAQFFINVVNNDETGKVANLNYPNSAGHGYAVFGEVSEGMDVVDKIKEVKTHRTSTLSLDAAERYTVGEFDDVPVDPVFIKSIRRAN